MKMETWEEWEENTREKRLSYCKKCRFGEIRELINSEGETMETVECCEFYDINAWRQYLFCRSFEEESKGGEKSESGYA